MRIFKIIGISLPIVLTLLYLIVIWTLSGRILFPESSFEKTKNIIAEKWGTTYEEMRQALPAESEFFEIKAFEDVLIKGEYFDRSSENKCLIILIHGWGATRHDMLKYVPVLENCDCDFAYYDHRVHGESGGRYATGGLKEAQDLWAVTDYLMEVKGFEASEIIWVGSSWGAATAIYAGAEDRNVGLIIVDAPFQDWYSAIFERAIRDYGTGIKFLSGSVMGMVNKRAGVNYEQASTRNLVGKVSEPLLIMHSTADAATAFFQSENIVANMNKETGVFFPMKFGSDHTMDVLNNKEEIRSVIEDFVAKYRSEFLSVIDSAKWDSTAVKPPKLNDFIEVGT